MSNQQIGALADSVKIRVRKTNKLMMDVRDRSWFLERAEHDPIREGAAEALAVTIADPYLRDVALAPRRAQALSSLEARAALVYLGIQWEDDTREKGLTTLCFEALVKAALRGTTPENRMTREKVREAVRAFMPTHDSQRLDPLIDSALQRLRRKSVTYSGADDSFCLSYDERQKLSELLAKSEEEDTAFVAELDQYINRLMLTADDLKIEENIVPRIRRALEKFLLDAGEAFAAGVVSGDFTSIGLEEVRSILISDANDHRYPKERVDTIDFSEKVISQILTSPTETMRVSLRRLADSYTLMAFLQETPDVQSAVVKMFSQGEIWIDTSAVLPLFTEDLELPETEKFIVLTRGAIEAGLKLHITSGVLEEVERHLNLCLAYGRSRDARQRWTGRVPYLYMAYGLSGRALHSFGLWIERFRGESRPEEDIAEFLEDRFGIDIQDLEEEERKFDSDIKHSADQAWYEVHEKRRGILSDFDLTVNRLARHDVENMIGVLAKRAGESKPAAFGFTNWWLTLDRSAPEIFERLRRQFPETIKASPLLSADFLLNYLALGPVRGRISRHTQAALPVILERVFFPMLPPELLEVADRVRTTNANLPEHVVLRRVRDNLDRARARFGPITQGGLDDIERAYASGSR
jgi:hypothetical protein